MSPLLNYTTSVPVSRTIGQVQGLLVEAGARAVQTSYDDVGRATGIAFQIVTSIGLRMFVLPINPNRVEAVLRRENVAPRYSTPEHAERVAWRILKDWVEAELVTLDQVMLPYMQADASGHTVYELFRDEQLALPAGGT